MTAEHTMNCSIICALTSCFESYAIYHHAVENVSRKIKKVTASLNYEHTHRTRPITDQSIPLRACDQRIAEGTGSRPCRTSCACLDGYLSGRTEEVRSS